jgi:hypothetical protein
LRAIERACNLSELLLRSLIIRADHVTQEQMEAADGTAELADEIKLKAGEPGRADDTRAPAPEAPAAGDTPGEKPAAAGEATEPITVETESPAKDPATTIDG